MLRYDSTWMGEMKISRVTTLFDWGGLRGYVGVVARQDFSLASMEYASDERK